MSKYTLKTETVESVGMTVRGLSPNDTVQLFLLHRESMEGLFKLFNGRDTASISDEEVKEVAMGMITGAPGFLGHIIALAADDVDNFDEIVTLPLGAQCAALEKIVALTFEGIAPKKFFGQVVQMVQSRA